ncbi:redoxin domain-containing protein [Flammeovirga yaeyamensis]|uniref:thioredoxin-dependent peroxiredoxin n=1 Tax=Flammeovirga yaeyamensis TaxID=367791 RepID=A0AAX1N5K8_9BACT|nr:peroxiredoxin family protein [Flammeovirga yaeyamensis]MBB3697417.1 peroxiredoxin [Flammeovirga yaeyamensis]NMF36111.1 AhpC/TSA family protein [Flammeovirga yaeyamensis]QWG02844.1 redoxin domain-containing protein [Flammeovirga yaeyamensis]
MKKIITFILLMTLQVYSYAQEKDIYAKYGIKVETLQPGLNVGDTAPDFSGTDQNGEKIMLSEMVKDGPVIVNFFRGSWCPSCYKHLKSIRDSLDYIYDTGAKIVMVSPEEKESLDKFAVKKKFTFPMISDTDMSVMNNYKVTFEVTEKYQKKIKTFLMTDIAANNALHNASLPVPATYIVDKNMKIIAKQYNPQYSIRMSPTAMIEAINAEQ